MRNLFTLFMLAGSSTALAEPERPHPTAYVSLGGVAGIEHLSVFGIQLEAGLRLGSSPFYARGAVEGGAAAALFDNGDYTTYRLGLEARLCGRRCWFAGIDGAVRNAALVHHFDAGMPVTDHYDDGLIIPRVGIDIGRGHLHGRFAVEVPTAFDSEDTQVGIAAAAAVSYAF